MAISFVQTLLSFLSACLGALLVTAIQVSHKQLCALISFAAGALLSITVFHILPETISSLGWTGMILAFLSGYALFYLISRYVFHVCPACAASHLEKHRLSDFKNGALLLAIALGIHSTMDGMALALEHDLKQQVTFPLFFSIFVHKFPEGLALCALLIKGGFSKKKAVLTSFAFESTTLLGWFLAVFPFRDLMTSQWIYIALAHVGGGFVYLALHALINESREHSGRFVIPFFLLGAGSIAAIAFLLP